MKKLKDLKLSVKLIGGGLAAVLIPMLVVGIISVNTASKAIVKAGEGAAFQVAEDLAGTAQLFLEEELKFANQMALSPLVEDVVSRVAEEGLDTAMDSVEKLDQHFTK
ncbi:MAG: methyl-accepting chemotaxis protein, partial [Desulfobacteraceae bacterium]|nr:methyl-accepting chemotaxis protein [Desulfobacteraceae bacterium]